MAYPRKDPTDYVGRIINGREILSRTKSGRWRYRCAACGKEGRRSIEAIQKTACAPCKSREIAEARIGLVILGRTITGVSTSVPRKYRWRCEAGHTGTTTWTVLNRHTCRACSDTPEVPERIDSKIIKEVVGHRSSGHPVYAAVCWRCGRTTRASIAEHALYKCRCSAKALIVFGEEVGRAAVVRRFGLGPSTVHRWAKKYGKDISEPLAKYLERRADADRA